MAISSLQVQLFQQIREQLPDNLSLADEVARLLKLSTDSAYRRIRGEKPLDLEEVHILCQHFQVSLDQILGLQKGGFHFSGSFVRPSTFQFDKYLEGVVQQMRYMSRFRQKKLFYLCKDIPLFHHFHVKELAAFKHFFWMRTILQTPEYARKKFSFDDYPQQLFDLGRKALDHYGQIDTTEIWNMESITSSIKQFQFYQDSDVFQNKDDIYRLYQSLETLVNHMEKQAEAGFKFPVHQGPEAGGGKFEMYFNEVILGDNSILAELDGSRIAFIIHSVINIISTRDVDFTNNMHEHIQNLLRKSTLISSVSERERSIFFHELRLRIEEQKLK